MGLTTGWAFEVTGNSYEEGVESNRDLVISRMVGEVVAQNLPNQDAETVQAQMQNFIRWPSTRMEVHLHLLRRAYRS